MDELYGDSRSHESAGDQGGGHKRARKGLPRDIRKLKSTLKRAADKECQAWDALRTSLQGGGCSSADASGDGGRFLAQTSNEAVLLQERTVGLVTRDEFRQAREFAEASAEASAAAARREREPKEKEAQEAKDMLEGREGGTGGVAGAGTKRGLGHGGGGEGHGGEERRQKKRLLRKQKKGKGLRGGRGEGGQMSFSFEEEEEEAAAAVAAAVDTEAGGRGPAAKDGGTDALGTPASVAEETPARSPATTTADGPGEALARGILQIKQALGKAKVVGPGRFSVGGKAALTSEGAPGMGEAFGEGERLKGATGDEKNASAASRLRAGLGRSVGPPRVATTLIRP